VGRPLARIFGQWSVTAIRVAVCAVLLAFARPAAAAPQTPASVRATIDKYCVTCHSQRLRTAGLSLETLDTTDIPAHAELWEKVTTRLRTGAMPPAGAPRPDAATAADTAEWLETSLDEAAARRPNPGRPPLHRLNRVEYANAVRDLLALEIDPRALLPADDQGYGFDNNAGALTMSPGLMDRYLLAARRIARTAIGAASTRPVVETFTVSRLLTQDDRIGEELPFGSRGGLAFRHQFPFDAEYVMRIRLQGATARTPGEQIDVRLDGQRIALLTTAAAPRAAGEGVPDPVLETRFAAKAGPRLIGVAVIGRTVVAEGLGPARLPVGNISFRSSGVSAVDLEGPFNPQGPGETPSRRRLFPCHPSASQEQRRCATEIASSLARRAFRRPAEERDVNTLIGFYDRARADGFEAGVQAIVERVLIDPEFLFRIERDPPRIAPGTAYRISDLELASRLSFFLWSSGPDEELLEAAARGRLRDPAVLRTQVTRLLADPRSAALVTNFASQWLHLRNLRAVAPDLAEFPDFDENLRQAFQRETELVIDSQLRENRPVTDLLTTPYTFLNERLARHYGIRGVLGSHFRRVTVDTPERIGLLGQGSILTVTSYATRTSPVLRGKWLLENILGTPPPAPPPNVPSLKENSEAAQPTTVRERMEEHRRNPVCASCHARMDPLGFALENFDAIGRWRTAGEDQAPIDASAALPDGTKFEGPVGLRLILVARRDQFAATIAEKMLTYALGRGVEYFDRPSLRAVMRQARDQHYTWSSIIFGIVTSTPFQMRSAKS
jgi:mono/diheme cytochrome c family protein